MKKKSASRSAFFNLRVLIGLFIVLAGVSLALVGFGTFSAIAGRKLRKTEAKAQNYQGASIRPLIPPGFDCSKIHQLGIDKMEDLRAGRDHDCLWRGQGRRARRRFSFTWQRIRHACPKTDASPSAHTVPLTLTWLRARRPLQILFSRRHTLRLTRMTPTRYCVAFNDSRGATPAATCHLRRIGLHRRRHDLYPYHQCQRSKSLCQYLW